MGRKKATCFCCITGRLEKIIYRFGIPSAGWNLMDHNESFPSPGITFSIDHMDEINTLSVVSNIK